MDQCSSSAIAFCLVSRIYFRFDCVIFDLWLLAPNGPPRNVQLEVLNSTAVSLNWEPPLPENQNGEITSYLIEITPLNKSNTHITSETEPSSIRMSIDAPRDRERSAPNYRKIFTRLHPGTFYSVIITAKNSKGDSPLSQPLSFQTKDNG